MFWWSAWSWLCRWAAVISLSLTLSALQPALARSALTRSTTSLAWALTGRCCRAAACRWCVLGAVLRSALRRDGAVVRDGAGRGLDDLARRRARGRRGLGVADGEGAARRVAGAGSSVGTAGAAATVSSTAVGSVGRVVAAGQRERADAEAHHEGGGRGGAADQQRPAPAAAGAVPALGGSAGAGGRRPSAAGPGRCVGRCQAPAVVRSAAAGGACAGLAVAGPAAGSAAGWYAGPGGGRGRVGRPCGCRPGPASAAGLVGSAGRGATRRRAGPGSSPNR